MERVPQPQQSSAGSALDRRLELCNETSGKASLKIGAHPAKNMPFRGPRKPVQSKILSCRLHSYQNAFGSLPWAFSRNTELPISESEERRPPHPTLRVSAPLTERQSFPEHWLWSRHGEEPSPTTSPWPLFVAAWAP